jgi:hypothetical protein
LQVMVSGLMSGGRPRQYRRRDRRLSAPPGRQASEV